mmetsp:Transcript_113565/g.321590  ORF Transcript_113565/g.321590 Transcript_113565/m.321590 type:complete len:430 (-) Transcript_113565:81-1370(-)
MSHARAFVKMFSYCARSLENTIAGASVRLRPARAHVRRSLPAGRAQNVQEPGPVALELPVGRLRPEGRLDLRPGARPDHGPLVLAAAGGQAREGVDRGGVDVDVVRPGGLGVGQDLPDQQVGDARLHEEAALRCVRREVADESVRVRQGVLVVQVLPHDGRGRLDGPQLDELGLDVLEGRSPGQALENLHDLLPHPVVRPREVPDPRDPPLREPQVDDPLLVDRVVVPRGAVDAADPELHVGLVGVGVPGLHAELQRAQLPKLVPVLVDLVGDAAEAARRLPDDLAVPEVHPAGAQQRLDAPDPRHVRVGLGVEDHHRADRVAAAPLEPHVRRVRGHPVEDVPVRVAAYGHALPGLLRRAVPDAPQLLPDAVAQRRVRGRVAGLGHPDLQRRAPPVLHVRHQQRHSWDHRHPQPHPRQHGRPLRSTSSA